MGSFDVVFLHGVRDYTRGQSPTPEVPDFGKIVKRLDAVQRNCEDDETGEAIKSIASAIDLDDSIETFIDRAHTKIDLLHCGIRNACAELVGTWDPDNMTRDEMVDFVSTLHSNLNDYLPESQILKYVAHSWFGYSVGKFVASHHALGQLLVDYQTSDTYHGCLSDDKIGDLVISACQGGVLRLHTTWLTGGMYFTRDHKIVMGSSKAGTNLFAMRLDEFTENFQDWTTPTEEEMSLFDVIHPGADWTVFRYLRDYQEGKYICSKPL